ncbi:hypothetical protein AsAng_0061020 [Aureispira anguillae]|uniref:Uncharacterized protein n=1 Tax=Aureispira anguillae TaxID=2864201 RepID=A0A915YM53_9BACT|nr:hypothetical protein AsAng_0061020 [Aureispira anguillae]
MEILMNGLNYAIWVLDFRKKLDRFTFRRYRHELQLYRLGSTIPK